MVFSTKGNSNHLGMQRVTSKSILSYRNKKEIENFLEIITLCLLIV